MLFVMKGCVIMVPYVIAPKCSYLLVQMAIVSLFFRRELISRNFLKSDNVQYSSIYFIDTKCNLTGLAGLVIKSSRQL